MLVLAEKEMVTLNYIIFAIRYPLFATDTLKGPYLLPDISNLATLVPHLG